MVISPRTVSEAVIKVNVWVMSDSTTGRRLINDSGLSGGEDVSRGEQLGNGLVGSTWRVEQLPGGPEFGGGGWVLPWRPEINT